MLPSRGLHIDQAPPLNIPFRFFVTAPFFLILCGLVLLQGGDTFLLAPLLGETIAVVHLITLGWIATVMFGAMYQMIPVLGGGPVPWVKGCRWVHILLIIGVVSLTLEVGLGLHPWFLLVASFGLAGAITLFFVPVAIALIRAPVVHPTIWAMRLAIVSLMAVLVMGMIFLGEYAHGFFEIDRHAMVGAHLVWGLFGWVATLIIGVSFHVLPMFYMMPPFPTRPAYGILMGLGLTWVLLPTLMLMFHPLPYWATWLAALPALLAIIVYGVTIKKLFNGRKRKQWDVPLRLWQTGFINGAMALALLAIWPVMETEKIRYLFVILFLFGFVSTVMTAMLYRIVPFLTWFHRYSQKAGMPGIPLMDDLTPKQTGKWQLWNQWLGIVLLVGGVLTGLDIFIRLGGLSLSLSGILILYLLYFALRQHEQPIEKP